jgi:hypothetical protein
MIYTTDIGYLIFRYYKRLVFNILHKCKIPKPLSVVYINLVQTESIYHNLYKLKIRTTEMEILRRIVVFPFFLSLIS